MKYFNLIFVFLISYNTIGQNLKTLAEKNGFRNIKLNSNAENYSSFENTGKSKELINLENSLIYSVETFEYELKNRYNSNMEIGGSEIMNIRLSTMPNGKIRSISVSVLLNGNVIDNLKLVFGEPTEEKDFITNKNIRQEFYIWESDNVKLTVSSHRSIMNGFVERYYLNYSDISLTKEFEELSIKAVKDLHSKKQKSLIKEEF